MDAAARAGPLLHRGKKKPRRTVPAGGQKFSFHHQEGTNGPSRAGRRSGVVMVVEGHEAGGRKGRHVLVGKLFLDHVCHHSATSARCWI